MLSTSVIHFAREVIRLYSALSMAQKTSRIVRTARLQQTRATLESNDAQEKSHKTENA